MTLLRQLKIWSDMIKLEHTVFSLPFMLVSMILVSDNNLFPSWKVLFWAILALLGARSAAMTINRILDRDIDAKNQRTVNRALVTGDISLYGSYFMSAIGFGLMLYSAMQLNTICVLLSPLAVFVLTLYSYTKRFTYWCHLVLGIAVGGAVLGGWLANSGSLFALLPYCLMLGVCFWIMGFDILYALQDMEFDQEHRLFSVPARFGLSKSLIISRVSHLLSAIFFVSGLFAVQQEIFIYYLAACLVLIIGLVHQQYIVSLDLKNIPRAFFQANAVISTVFFIIIFLGKLVIYF